MAFPPSLPRARGLSSSRSAAPPLPPPPLPRSSLLRPGLDSMNNQQGTSVFVFLPSRAEQSRARPIGSMFENPVRARETQQHIARRVYYLSVQPLCAPRTRRSRDAKKVAMIIRPDRLGHRALSHFANLHSRCVWPASLRPLFFFYRFPK